MILVLSCGYYLASFMLLLTVMIYPTTSQHFEFFKKECNRFLNEFGLIEYRLFFYHEDIKKSMATCRAQFDNKVVSLTLNKKWSDKPTKQELSNTAFHEVLHILLAGLIYIGEARFINDGEFDVEEELVVSKLEAFIKSKKCLDN